MIGAAGMGVPIDYLLSSFADGFLAVSCCFQIDALYNGPSQVVTFE